jgi:hypothetical protein
MPATSHASKMVTDLQVICVVRLFTDIGTYMAMLQLTYFLTAVNYHRRAGAETHSIHQDDVTFSFYRNHRVVTIKDGAERKDGNFTTATSTLFSVLVL